MNILSKEIIKEWGLSSLPESKQKEIVSQISHILYQAVLVRALDILSADEQDELDSLMEKNATTPQDVMLYLQSKIPTFERMVFEERKNLKEELLVTA